MKIVNLRTVNEGLIKLPQRLLKDINEFVVGQYLSYLHYALRDGAQEEFWGDTPEDREREHREWHADAYEAVEGALAAHGVRPHPRQTLGIAKSFSSPENDLPPSYGDNQNEFQLRVTVDMTGERFRHFSGKTVAFYDTHDIEVVINAAMFIGDRPTSKGANSIRRDLNKMLSSIKHELTHYVQFAYLQHRHPKQVAGKGEVSNKHELPDEFVQHGEYYTSQVEFDPHVKSVADEFIDVIPERTWRLMTRDDYNHVLGVFTGTRPRQTGLVHVKDGDKDVALPPIPPTPSFLRFLKREDRRRYQKALKLIDLAARQELKTRYSLQF